MCCRAENTNALPCGDTFVRFACWFLCTRKDKAVGEQIDVFIVQVDENNFLLTPPRIVMTVSVCLSAREHKSGITRPMLTEFFCACYLCPWLGPPLAALRYVMYCRFYG